MKLLLLFLLTHISITILFAQPMQYPKTDTVNQVDDYFGTKVSDPYRWLENDTSEKTAAWVAEQNKLTVDYLHQIPVRSAIKDRLTELWNYPKYSAPYREGAYYLFYKNSGLQNQAVLYVQNGKTGEPAVLLDPNLLSKDGTVALQNFQVSKHQKFAAYSVSASGSDWQEIFVMDFKTRKSLADKLAYVKFTSISWNGDDGFYYSGYTKPENEKGKFSEKNQFQKIFYHKIGTPQTADKLIYEDTANPLRYYSANLTEDGRYLVLNIAEGTDGSEIKIKDMQEKFGTDWITIVPGFATNASVIDNVGDELLLYTNYNAPTYQVVKLHPQHAQPQNWITIIAAKKEPLDNVGSGGGKLFASYLRNAITEVEQYSYAGTFERKIKLPGIGTASGFHAEKDDTELFYTFTSFVYPNTIFKYNIASGVSSLFRKSEAKFNPENFVTEQIFYTSKDGTQVPMFITYKKGLVKNGQNPTLLYGYGGFNINILPTFSIAMIPFLERGGVYAVANIRGGGEYGETWHKGGMLQNKQNVFDDFIAAAEYLTNKKYTNPQKLALRGGSNGGLLVGAVITQRPDICKVAIPQVGVLDMLRYQKFTVGWGWVVEYGSSDTAADFNYLYKYSPLHNVKNGTCYPATLITTADHDDRVVPAHSFKFAATLQQAQNCSNPTLIRIDTKAGHGAGKPTSKQIDEAADILSFIFYNM